MPTAPKRPCRNPRCPALVASGYCDACRPAVYREQDARRGSSTERGYGSRWQKARATYLRSHPLCTLCMAFGRTTAATVVDHITPHKGDSRLFWDSANNWMSLCAPCHNAKTAREAGTFGRAPAERSA